MAYMSPEILFNRRRLINIPISGTIGATAQNSFSTSHIPFKYRIVKVRMYFRDDAVWNVLMYWFSSSNPQGSTANLPDGTNIFAYASNTPFFVSDGPPVEAECSYESNEDEHYIKLHVVNNNGYATNVNGVVTIEEVPE